MLNVEQLSLKAVDKMSHNIKSLNPSNSILFLGSGFSAGALNVVKEQLPAGNPLKLKLARHLGVNADEYDLRTIVDVFASNQDTNLYNILYETFTVRSPLPAQREILNLDWSRVYTTNYDDLIESVFAHAGKRAQSFNYDSIKPRSLPKSFVVHLHGSIRDASEENALSQLVLNEASYIRQFFEKSPWFEEFRRDLQFCDACFFVGYSLSDYHISALLSSNIEAFDKTFFITGSTPDAIFMNRASSYGTVLQIGREGFAKLCRELPNSSQTADLRSLKSLKHLDARSDNKSSSAATPIEVHNLVAYGKFVYNRYVASYQASNYVVGRKSLVSQAESFLRASRTMIVHSRLGNGKTIFLAIISQRLTSLGFRCFQWKGRPPNIDAELNVLKDLDRLIIIFDDYDAAVENIKFLADRLVKAKFIVSVRSGRQEVRFHEISSIFPSPITRLGVDKLDSSDKIEIIGLLNQSGLYVGDMHRTVSEASEIREIVSSLYNHADIRRKIVETIDPILANKSFRAVFIGSHLAKWAGLDIDPSFLNASSRTDAYAEMSRYREITTDLFLVDDEKFIVRSSLLSNYLLEKVLKAEDILEEVHNLILSSAERKIERRYRALMSELMKVSALRRMLSSDYGFENKLEHLFERLARDIIVNAEPLFWLQYTILMTDNDKLELAEQFLATSYERALASPGFLTYQIDTQALRVLVKIETAQASNQPVMRFDRILGTIQAVVPMISDESHRGYAVRVLKNIEPFVDARKSDLTASERYSLCSELRRLVYLMDLLSTDLKVETGSEIVRRALQRSCEKLL